MFKFLFWAGFLVVGLLVSTFLQNSCTAWMQGKNVADVYNENEAARQNREVEVPYRQRQAQKKADAEAADKAEAKKIWDASKP